MSYKHVYIYICSNFASGSKNTCGPPLSVVGRGPKKICKIQELGQKSQHPINEFVNHKHKKIFITSR